MAEPIKTYLDLVAWQKAFQLGCKVHRLAGTLPEHERFGLIAQLRRDARSPASQIANGYGRGNTNDYVWYLKQARGSLYDLDTQLRFSLEFEYINREQHEPVKSMFDECERVLGGLIRSLGG